MSSASRALPSHRARNRKAANAELDGSDNSVDREVDASVAASHRHKRRRSTISTTWRTSATTRDDDSEKSSLQGDRRAPPLNVLAVAESWRMGAHRIALAFAALAACGRIGFDTAGTGRDGASVSDCSGSGCLCSGPAPCEFMCTSTTCIADCPAPCTLSCPPGSNCILQCGPSGASCLEVPCMDSDGCVESCDDNGSCM
jgi:hypothetical protein